jgi:hypothetical protein
LIVDVCQEDIEELRGLADVVLEGDLCSCLFGAFVRGIQEDTGFEPGYLVRATARRVESLGFHLDPGEIAGLLLACANDLT